MPASGVRTHTTARLEFDRETYTPCTSEELPSFAAKAATIAARSDLVAGRAEELLANAAVVGVVASTMTASATVESERSFTSTDPSAARRTSPQMSEISSCHRRRDRRRPSSIEITQIASTTSAATATIARPGARIAR